MDWSVRFVMCYKNYPVDPMNRIIFPVRFGYTFCHCKDDNMSRPILDTDRQRDLSV